ncbi:maleylacetoacetate isomerase [Plasticicumulans lactativorans]|uniref:Maleylacetoacetate isomerase n=1 Tax=Plasticicumulans lactativorans TaxID=1133106 RepID=A0A4R2L5R6_9GAMM|nr:maleylacetoacetate isomerase [Plasticicumulans lactativorans]TCO79266.1 maleylacetoacetate isomerase [Plasticicumulans lactativorans]
MQLHDYFRSSAAYRVRIALNLKGLAYQHVPVNLVRGEEAAASYRALNPQGLVPALVLDDGSVLTQSLAICEYLDETHPEPPLLPRDPAGRARVRALAQVVACDIHPINNLRVLKYLVAELGASEAQKLDWYRHWVTEGLAALEALLAGHPASGRYCHGDRPTLADVCLVPQVFNARRFDCPLDAFPSVTRIVAACEALDAFAAAAPDRQPDAR